MESAKLFVYPKDFKFPRGLRARLAKAGYILVPEDRVGSVRIIEPLPEFDMLSDSGWLLKTLLVMLDGWEKSKGATLEHHIADVLGITRIELT